MKNILFILLTCIIVLSFSCNNELKKSDNVFFKAQNLFPEKKRPTGQKDVIELASIPPVQDSAKDILSFFLVNFFIKDFIK